ncbi:MAG: hypothetical protein RI989_1566 [Bacteroidota bacterium]
MRKTLFALSLLLCSVAAFAQSHLISGTATYPNGTAIRLWKTTGRTLDLVDSTTITNNSFKFKGTYGEGLYALGVAPSNMAIIAMDNAEKETVFSVQGVKWDNGISCTSGNRNQLWFEYVKKENEFTQKKRALNIRWKKDKDSTAEKELTDLEASFNTYQLECTKRDQQTTTKSFVSQLIDWKREPSKDKAHYWDNLNFSDERVVHTTVLNDRIQSFMRQFSKGTESGFIDCIGLLTEKAHANDRVYEFVLNEMLTGFYESGMENITLYLMDNFINDESSRSPVTPSRPTAYTKPLHRCNIRGSLSSGAVGAAIAKQKLRKSQSSAKTTQPRKLPLWGIRWTTTRTHGNRR